MLANKINREMYIFDKKHKTVEPIFIARESVSGNTVQTEYGKLLRVNTRRHSIFYSEEMAHIARKTLLEQFDTEYEELLKKNKLRRTKPTVSELAHQ